MGAIIQVGGFFTAPAGPAHDISLVVLTQCVITETNHGSVINGRDKTFILLFFNRLYFKALICGSIALATTPLGETARPRTYIEQSFANLGLFIGMHGSKFVFLILKVLPAFH